MFSVSILGHAGFVCAYLHVKADKRAAEANGAVTAVEKTHKRAKALDADIKSTLKKIQGN